MSANSTAVASLSATQKAGVVMSGIVILLAFIGLFSLCNYGTKGCQKLSAFFCTLLCFAIAACIIAIVAISENPANLTWVQSHF